MVLKVNQTTTSLDQYTSNPEWNLVSWKVKEASVLFDCCPHPYAVVDFFITLERKSLLGVFLMIMPCITFCVPILVGFALPPESGERILLIIKVMLTVIFFIQMASNELPRNSNEMAAIGKFYIVNMTLVLVSILGTSYVLGYYFKRDYLLSRPLKSWVVRLLKLGHHVPLLSDKCKHLLQVRQKNEMKTVHTLMRRMQTSDNFGADLFSNIEGNSGTPEGDILDEGFGELEVPGLSVELPNQYEPNETDVDEMSSPEHVSGQSSQSIVTVTSYRLQLDSLKGISNELNTIAKSIEKEFQAEKEKSDQGIYAQAISDLLDVIILVIVCSLAVISLSIIIVPTND